MSEWKLQKDIKEKYQWTERQRQTQEETDSKMKEAKLGLIPTMTRANRINPPSLEEGRGWWGFKLRQALQ